MNTADFYEATPENLSDVEVNLIGTGSRVRIDGIEVKGLTDVRVHQRIEGQPEVTLTFLAASVTGLSERKE